MLLNSNILYFYFFGVHLISVYAKDKESSLKIGNRISKRKVAQATKRKIETNLWGLSEDPNDVKFSLYYDYTKPDQSYTLKYGDSTNLQKAPFVKGKSVVLITHGFGSEAYTSESWVPVIRKAYLSRKRCNIIAVDWSALSSTSKFELIGSASYPSAVNRVPIAGKRIGELITKLLKMKLLSSSKDFHLIGHSLGAHVMGVAGRTVKLLWRSRVSRITGLDPAGPSFTNKNDKMRLSINDAVFVDVIHSDFTRFGIAAPCGTIDFYVDGGTYRQCKGITKTSCAHNYAPEIFARSILKGKSKVYGYPCHISASGGFLPGTFSDGCVLRQQGSGRGGVQFGQCVPTNARGTYYIDSRRIKDR